MNIGHQALLCWPVCAAFFVWAAFSSSEADAAERLAAGIQDNSFLVEEAYNQEPGVVQHIQSISRTRDGWFYTFVQEWPVISQVHQFSYNIPYSRLRGEDGRSSRGFGDVQINYRPQIWIEGENLPAYTQRFSLIVPSGSRGKGLGEGSFGFQTNAAFSKIVSDRVTLHANAGLTTYFDVEGRRPTSASLRGSAIYAVSQNFNLMMEVGADWNQRVEEGAVQREFVTVVSPGIRYALNYPSLSNLQVVLGIAAPTYFKKNGSTDHGVFLYLSFEHKYQRASIK